MKMQNGQEKKWVNGYDSHLPSIYFTESIGLRQILAVSHLV